MDSSSPSLTLFPEEYFWTTHPENTILFTFCLTILPWVFILHRRAFELLGKKWLALVVTFLTASCLLSPTSCWTVSPPHCYPFKILLLSAISKWILILLYILCYNRLPCLHLCWPPARMYSLGTSSTYFLFAPQTVEGSLICDSFPDFNTLSTPQKLVVSLCAPVREE